MKNKKKLLCNCGIISRALSGATYFIATFIYFFLFFTGDFSETAEGISTELSTQTADGLE